MFGLSLLFTIIVYGVVYTCVALALNSYSRYRRALYVPEPHDDGHGEITFAYTNKQKKSREYWEFMQIACMGWPLTVPTSLLTLGCSTILRGLRSVTSLAEKRTAEATRRSMVKALEEKREHLIEKGYSENDLRLRNVDAQIKSPEMIRIRG